MLKKMRPTTSKSSNDKQNEKKTVKKPLHETALYIKVEPWQWPIVYSPEYNIALLGIEKLHPFDSAKWCHVYEFLKEVGMLRDHTSVRPLEASLEDLMVVHPKRYIDNLKLTNIVEGIQEWSVNVAGITEVPPVALFPNFVIQRKVLRPFRFQVGGSILAGKLALERGWAINIGGGFHHCCAEKGGGFCAYADITLAIRFMQQRLGVKNAMIIDLDAHQGNGHGRDFMGDKSVYILDIYNRGIYPHDGFAKRGISRKIELSFYTEDEEYLQLVRTHVEGALNEFRPDVIVYNAGTDILDGDPLGCMSISPQGIIERDQIVFQKVRTRGIPIMMVTSGGYQRSTAKIIANSILNLQTLGLIQCDEAANAPEPEPEPIPVPTESRAHSAMKRSISEGASFFARFRRLNNCFDLSRSQTTQNFPAKTLSSADRRKCTSATKLEHTTLHENDDESSDEEIFTAYKLKAEAIDYAFKLSQLHSLKPEVEKAEVNQARSSKITETEISESSDSSEFDCEKLSLFEALSGLRKKKFTSVDDKTNNLHSGKDSEHEKASKSLEVVVDHNLAQAEPGCKAGLERDYEIIENKLNGKLDVVE